MSLKRAVITTGQLFDTVRLHSQFKDFTAFETHPSGLVWAVNWGFYDCKTAWANNPHLALSTAYELKLVASGLDMHYVDYRERMFTQFHVEKSASAGPGWYIWGRHNTEYRRADDTGGLVCFCGRPNVPYRRHPHYNIKVRSGWKTKADAQLVCDLLNQGYTVQPRRQATLYED